MENLDGTVIATALPQMAKTFHADPVGMNVGMTAYLLAVAVFIPISGWVADRFGSRSVFATAILLFTCSSVLCGFSNSLLEFTSARVLQGIGGAMMVPVGRLVVLRTTEKKNLVRAIAYITWPGLAAPIIGPPLGGFITTFASWRWIFFLNVPLGVCALGLTFLWVRNEFSSERTPFDGTGFGLVAIASAFLMYSMDLLSRPEIPWAEFGVLFGVAVALGTVLIFHSRRVEYPLFDFKLVRIPTFAVTIWGGSAFRMAIGATPFLLPLMFQVGYGLSAYRSGLLVLAVFAGNLAMKPATTPILKKFGFKTALIGNGILAAISLFSCSLLSPETPKLLILAVLFAGGLFRSMQFTSLNTIGYADVEDAQMSRANSLLSTVQQITGGMGIAVGAIALRIATRFSPAHGSSPTVADFQIAFAILGALALVAVIDCFSLKPNAGDLVSGHKS
jgi:EmrB/QacA subfamily drug resistance transporter